LADFSDEQLLSNDSLSPEKREEIVARVLDKKRRLVATMLKCDISEVDKFSGEYFEDLQVSCMERMSTNIEKDKIAKIKAKMKEKEAQ